MAKRRTALQRLAAHVAGIEACLDRFKKPDVLGVVDMRDGLNHVHGMVTDCRKEIDAINNRLRRLEDELMKRLVAEGREAAHSHDDDDD